MVDPCFTVCSEHMVYFSRAFATAGSDFSDFNNNNNLKRPRPLVSINYTKNAVANLHHCLQHGTNEASQSLEIRMQLDGKIFDPRSASFAHNSCVPVLLVLYYLQYTVQCRAEDFLLDYKFWKSSAREFQNRLPLTKRSAHYVVGRRFGCIWLQTDNGFVKQVPSVCLDARLTRGGEGRAGHKNSGSAAKVA